MSTFFCKSVSIFRKFDKNKTNLPKKKDGQLKNQMPLFLKMTGRVDGIKFTWKHLYGSLNIYFSNNSESPIIRICVRMCGYSEKIKEGENFDHKECKTKEIDKKINHD